MSEIRKDCLYTKDHEWVKKASSPKVIVVGISDFAQAALGDVTYLQLPAPGKSVKQGEIIGSVESVKAVSDIYAPLSGKVVKVNEALVADPSAINSDPFGNAWMVELELDNEGDLSTLLSAEAYASHAQ